MYQHTQNYLRYMNVSLYITNIYILQQFTFHKTV